MGGRKRGPAVGLRAAGTLEAHQGGGNTPKRKSSGVSEDLGTKFPASAMIPQAQR